MKRIISFCFFFAFAATAFAQKENFDLVTYTPPSGWQKEITQNTINYIIADKKNNTWCQVGIVKSTESKGGIEQDFENEWQGLVVKNYAPTGNPQSGDVQEADGWKIKTGAGKFIFNNSEAIVMLTTASGFGRCVSIIATTNSQDYFKDIESLLSSVDLKKPEANIEHAAVNGSRSVIGTWGVSSVVASNYNMRTTEGVIMTQYTFNANGTYSFYIKTFRYQLDKLLLTRETGVYQINGTSITIIPKKSVIESWSKKNGTDQWGELVSSQKKDLEKVTYQFHIRDGISGAMLVLKAAPTKRDGAYNNSDNNEWLYPTKSKIEFIELPGGKQVTDAEVQNEPISQATTDNSASIVGIWKKNGSVNPAYNDAYATSIAGYTSDQYTFAANGTYRFVSKTFRMSFDKILLVKENGTYQISGNNIIITPQKSEIQAWSKKDGVDKWGKLLTTQKRSIEKTTYQFTKHYFSGIQQWNLVLQGDKATQRDGPFSNNTLFTNAWYYSPISSNNPVIELPAGQ